MGLSPGDETVNNDNGDGSALVLEDGSTPGIKSSALEFNISNTGQSPVTITEFSLSTPGKSNSNADAVDSIDRDATGNTGENAEVQIRDRDGDELLGYTTPGSGQSDNFDTDGSLYVMDRKGDEGRGEEATINSDTVVSVDMGEFNDGNTLQYSSIDSKADSDLTATFTLEGDTTVEFYFEVTAANT